VEAASGAKYATDAGRSSGRTLVWWTQGQDGTLYEGTVGGTEADEQEVASCSQSIATAG
jgi:membrane-bound inhibitor of C-type lysozyme